MGVIGSMKVVTGVERRTVPGGKSPLPRKPTLIHPSTQYDCASTNGSFATKIKYNIFDI
jgi:hypothetical protein